MRSRKDDSSDQELSQGAPPPPRPGVFLPYRIPFAPTAPPCSYPSANHVILALPGELPLLILRLCVHLRLIPFSVSKGSHTMQTWSTKEPPPLATAVALGMSMKPPFPNRT